jgi:hypothetical protein
VLLRLQQQTPFAVKFLSDEDDDATPHSSSSSHLVILRGAFLNFLKSGGVDA